MSSNSSAAVPSASTGEPAATGTKPDAREKANSGGSVRQRANELRGSIRKQSLHVHQLIRERDALERQDDGRRRPAKASSRVAALDDELEKAIRARNAVIYELDDMLGGGDSDEDEGYFSTPSSCNSVRLFTLAILLLNSLRRVPKICEHCGCHPVLSRAGGY